MLHTKYQPNIPCHSGEKVDFIGFTNFAMQPSWILNHLEFHHSEALCLVMLHVKFENHGCSGFRE